MNTVEIWFQETTTRSTVARDFGLGTIDGASQDKKNSTTRRRNMHSPSSSDGGALCTQHVDRQDKAPISTTREIR
jgi:hypothetical protein